MSTKKCRVCKLSKDLNEFHNSSSNKDGKAGICKVCKKKDDQRYRRTKEGLIAQMYSHQKSSSTHRKMGLPKYSKDELLCFLLENEVFNTLYEEWVLKDYLKDFTPSVDRLDDYKGYSFDNIQIITWRENCKKHHNDRRHGVNNKHSKAIYLKNLSTGKVIKFNSMSEAKRRTGTRRDVMTWCCNGEREQPRGFVWSFNGGEMND